MLNLEDKEWKVFSISEIFNKIYIAKSQDFGKMKKGKTPFVGRGVVNNGFQDMVDSKIEEEGNCISIGMIGFRAFYRDVKFACSQNILILRMNQLTRNKALFLNSIFNSTILLIFSYGKPIKLANFKKQKILLPVNEKSEPDYEYMEEYTKSTIDKKLEDYKKYAESVLKDIEYKEIKPLENKEWKEFFISGENGLFNINSTQSGIDKNKVVFSDLDNGKTPYITRTDINNGINLFIYDNQLSKYKKNDGNVITIGLDTQTVFYQPHNFFTGQNIQVMKHDLLNKYNSLFLIPLIKVQMEKFNWGGNGATLGRLVRTKIMLPINEKNEPDYEYMEQYSKNLMYKKINQYLDYKNKEA